MTKQNVVHQLIIIDPNSPKDHWSFTSTTFGGLMLQTKAALGGHFDDCYVFEDIIEACEDNDYVVRFSTVTL